MHSQTITSVHLAVFHGQQITLTQFTRMHDVIHLFLPKMLSSFVAIVRGKQILQILVRNRPEALPALVHMHPLIRSGY
jgi:hypothetical protein